jgi:hypothetical protein
MKWFVGGWRRRCLSRGAEAGGDHVAPQVKPSNGKCDRPVGILRDRTTTNKDSVTASLQTYYTVVLLITNSAAFKSTLTSQQ